MPQKSSRPVNMFDVPKMVSAESGVKEIGMVALTSEEELLCFKRAKGDNAKLASELAKTSLVEADGKALASVDGTVDMFWGGMHPKLRQLVMTAYAEIHAPPEEEAESFLKSRRTRVA
jgi:hypothetical protein